MSISIFIKMNRVHINFSFFIITYKYLFVNTYKLLFFKYRYSNLLFVKVKEDVKKPLRVAQNVYYL